MKKPIVIAHRGASVYAPENTLSAIIKALELKSGGLELDIRFTSDNVPVIIHDDKVDRTSNGKGYVRNMRLNELEALDFGSWFSPLYSNERILTLDKLFSLLEPWHGIINLELKYDPYTDIDLEKIVIDQIRKSTLLENVILSSFNIKILELVKKSAPEIKLGILCLKGLIPSPESIEYLDATSIHPHYSDISVEFVNNYKDFGLLIYPYTVDNPEDIKKVGSAGVDGIITNVPDVAYKALKDI